jgi:Dolichyl-phosphate-mannose-protein mannosyltransferase
MSRRQAAWSAFACAAFARLLYLVVARPQFEYDYWLLAENIIHHGTLGFEGVPTTRFEPGYPLLVAALRIVFRDHVFPAQVAQIVIGSLGAVWLYDLAETLTGNTRVAFIASLLFAFNPLLVRHASDGTDVTLMATLLVGFCRAFVRASSVAGAAMAGVWLGCAMLTRSMALPILVLASLALLIERGASAAVVLAAAALAVFAPFALRNYLHNGALMPTRTGLNLFVSNSVYTDALVPEHHADWLEPYADETLAANGVAIGDPVGPAVEREQDRMLARIAWQTMRTYPLANVIRRVHFAGYLFSPFAVPQRIADGPASIRLGDPGHVVVEGTTPRPILDRLIYTLSFVPVFVLAIVGGWARRGSIRRDGVLWCVLLGFVAVHTVFFPATRYRAPMEFVLFFFAAVAIDALLSRWTLVPASRPASVA